MIRNRFFLLCCSAALYRGELAPITSYEVLFFPETMLQINSLLSLERKKRASEPLSIA